VPAVRSLPFILANASLACSPTHNKFLTRPNQFAGPTTPEKSYRPP
jgi:hypothetical protein